MTSCIPHNGHRLLLVDDDDEIVESIIEDLSCRGFLVSRVRDGEAGLNAALNDDFDALIVDRLLPGMDGLSLVQAFRARNTRTPVLVLSALSAVDDRVKGLKAGGDDYLTKPFALVELAARIEALLRRPAAAPEALVLRIGPLEMDLVQRMARYNGVAIDLLPREFKLLHYMAGRPEQLMTRAMLLEDVWNYRFVPQSNIVDVHVGKLRRKLELHAKKALIESVRGEGFMFHMPE